LLRRTDVRHAKARKDRAGVSRSSVLAKATMTSKEVAQWMLDQMGDSHWLHQEDLVRRGICLQEQERKVWHPKGGIGRVKKAYPRTACLGAWRACMAAQVTTTRRERERWAGVVVSTNDLLCVTKTQTRM
jgi:hypothetical protein